MSEVSVSSSAASGRRKRKHCGEDGYCNNKDEEAGILPLLLGLGDALSTVLSFLDASSLATVEITCKILKDATEKAWTTIDACMDNKTKADGATARERVIRSCSVYRRHVLTRYADEVERMAPNHRGNFTLLPFGAKTSDYDFYLRFSKGGDVADATVLLEGIFKPHEVIFSDNDLEGLTFGMDGCNLSEWPAMLAWASPDGNGWSPWYSEEGADPESDDEADEALMGVVLHLNVTIVAVDSKTLAKRLVFLEDDAYFNASYVDEYLSATIGGMHPGDELEEDGTIFTSWRSVTLVYIEDGGWEVEVRTHWG
mmetsp:Transcript_19432/g.39332  ORF Transcript_19432/g.39332 Transcript_19432/m.39332 type:complete len:312 (+) Transcript_19432:264-1199(+)